MKPHLIVALDFDEISKVENILDKLHGICDFYKVGCRLFTRYGPKVVELLKKRGCKVFLDLKLHDIPQVVSGAVHAAEELDVDIITLHTLGGLTMLHAAHDAREGDKPLLFGVTILTSISHEEFNYILGRDLVDTVFRLAKIAVKAHLDGIVASPLEVSELKKKFGKKLLMLTPGIRLEKDQKHDQARFATPKDAVLNGADYLVVGRTITQAKEPEKVATKLLQEIESAYNLRGQNG